MTVRLECSGNIAELVLDRAAKRNALNTDMLLELGRLADKIAAEPAVRAVILRGEGPMFCAGADLREFAGISPASALAKWIPAGQRAFARLAALPQPSVAAISGSALGGGLEIAMAATFRVAAPDAIFGMPETSIGTLPGWSGLSRLPALVGTQRARRMIVLGERVPAAVAADWGLVDRVDPDPVTAARALAADLASRSPTAMRLALAVLAEPADNTRNLVEQLAAAATVESDEVQAATAPFRGAR